MGLFSRKDASEEAVNAARDEANALRTLAEAVFDTEEMKKRDFAYELTYRPPSLDRLIELKKQGRWP